MSSVVVQVHAEETIGRQGAHGVDAGGMLHVPKPPGVGGAQTSEISRGTRQSQLRGGRICSETARVRGACCAGAVLWRTRVQCRLSESAHAVHRGPFDLHSGPAGLARTGPAMIIPVGPDEGPRRNSSAGPDSRRAAS